jgi:pyrimidine-nucleoside phosphorylase
VDFVSDVIAWKRDGRELDATRLRAFVEGSVSGAVPSYQASALLMAMVLRGLSDAETLDLARALVDSGKTLDLSVLRRPVLDKHSSGGVGDKVTLVLAPLVAACGAVFGKMSGRGLGHTGGTLDKLESIPGFRVQLPQGEFLRQLERIGVAVVSQSERLVPADRVLYALRDVTATIENDGLIAASIMAKKVASGTSALVLDLKVGGGAFMADLERAQGLGRLCRLIGDAYERPTTCIYTAMDAPIGRAVGKRREVE